MNAREELESYLAMTHEEVGDLFLQCHDEIHRAYKDLTNAEVKRDLIIWANRKEVPYYVRRHFERAREQAQGLPQGNVKLPDLYHIGGKED